jgi:hypothetical protein
MARRKNTRFIDPRYFMDEKMERLDEAFDIDSFLSVADDPYADAGSKMKHMSDMSRYYKQVGEKLSDAAKQAQNPQYKKYLTTGLSAVRHSPFREPDAQALKVNSSNFHEWIGKMANLFLRASSPGAEQNAENQLAFTKDPRWKTGSDVVSDNPRFSGVVQARDRPLDRGESDRAALQEEEVDQAAQDEKFFDDLEAISRMLPDHRRDARTNMGHDMAIRLVGSPEAGNFSQTRDVIIKSLSVLSSALYKFVDSTDRRKMMTGVAYSYGSQDGPPREL